MDLPEGFLKRWLQTAAEKPKTAEKVEAEYSSFASSLKWTVISNKLVTDNKIEVTNEDIKNFAKAQLFQYMGNQLGMMDTDQQWVEDYAVRMLKDRKFVEDSYHRISTDKMFAAVEAQVSAREEVISAEDFASKLHHHHH
jgi:trigger factor